MKFVAVEDIAAPIDHVWTRVADIDRFEGRLKRRVGRIERRPPGPAHPGTTWQARAAVAGKVRDVAMTLEAMDVPKLLSLSGGTDGMEVTIAVELELLNPRLTRLTVTSEARARSLAARLMLQSAKLARQTLAKRYKQRVADFASEVEAGFARG